MSTHPQKWNETVLEREEVPPFFRAVGSEFYPPISADEIAFALSLFVASANGQFPAQIPLPRAPLRISHRECLQSFAELSGEPRDAPFTPLRRAFATVWHHYEQDTRQKSICARVIAFYFLTVQTAGTALTGLIDQIEGSPESVVLHPAVVQAIAITPLGSNARLCAPVFAAVIASIANAA